MSGKDDAVPPDLLRNLADSEWRVESWNGSFLTIAVEKEIGPELGTVRFKGVSHVSVPPQMQVETISIGDLADLPKDFLGISRTSASSLDPDERVFIINGSWGERFFVIAEAIDYLVR